MGKGAASSAVSTAVLTRALILAADDHKRERVEVPEWGGAIYVRTMTGAERDQWEAQMFDANGKAMSVAEKTRNMRARMAVLVVVDEKGDRLFSDDDAGALGAKTASALSRVFDVAARLNGLTARDIDELAGN